MQNKYTRIDHYDVSGLTHYFNSRMLLHRTDGPAVTCDNCPYKAWFINGSRLSLDKEKILNVWWEQNNKSPKIIFDDLGICNCSCGALYADASKFKPF